jgi:hypothetical protein
MQLTHRFRTLCALIGVLGLSGAATHAQAQIMFHVSLDTSSLTTLAGPFSLDYQLNDGSGTNDANNTAILSNFAFGTGGSTLGTPTLAGGATGDLNTSVTLTDSDFLNEFTQDFAPGSLLQYDVNLTTNVDTGGSPDAFSFAIFQNGVEIPTTDPGNAFLSINLDSATPTIQTFASDTTQTSILLGPAVVTFPAQTTPEPGALALLMGTAVLGTNLLVRRRRSRC